MFPLFRLLCLTILVVCVPVRQIILIAVLIPRLQMLDDEVTEPRLGPVVNFVDEVGIPMLCDPW